MKLNINTIILVAVVLCLITSGLALVYSLQGEKTCVKIGCSKYVAGDEWVARFCKVNDNKTDMECSFSIDGQNYVAPLSQINTSQFRSCVEERCEVAIKIYKGGKVK